MQNFVFHNPTKVIFGKNSVESLGTETIQLGKRVLLLSGTNSAKQSGLLDRAKLLLAKAGCVVFEHCGISANPTVEDTRIAIRLAKESKIDVICGLGGGSVIDTAKAVSAGSLVEHDVWKFFTGKKSIKATLPVIAVSTLAASGSEMNSGMVLTNSAKSQKFGFGHRMLHPAVAIMDPELTFTVQPDQTAYGIIDAFSHVLEFYMTNTTLHTDIQDRYMEGIAATLISNCPLVLEEPQNYQARANIMWGAGLALNGLSVAGLGKVGFPMHLIEHSLSALYNVPHGAGLSVVIPGWLQYHTKSLEQRISQFFAHALQKDISSANEGVDWLTDWLKRMGAPTTLQELQIEEEDIPKIAENCLDLAKVWRMRDYNIEKVTAILSLCAK